MKRSIDQDTFCRLMRENPYNSFSVNGLICLFEMLETLEENCGEEIEFDPVAIRCQFSEFKDFREIVTEYSETLDVENPADLDEYDSRKILINNGAIFQHFCDGVILDVESF